MVSRSFKTTFSIAIILLSIFPENTLYAQDRGGYTGSFLRLGLGARARALGGAFTAIPGDGYSVYYNPAGLPDLPGKEVTLSYRNLSLDRTFIYTGVALKIPPTGGFALGWLHAGIDNIDGRDSNGNPTQTFSDSRNGFLFAFGVNIAEGLNIGMGGTILRQDVVDITATGFGLNFGILYKPLSFVSIGAAIRDINAKLSWNSEPLFDRGSTTSDAFPQVYTAGAGIDVKRYNTLVVFDIYKNSKSDPGFRIGFESKAHNTLVLRAGMNDGELTTGFGLKIPLMKSEGFLNYAFEMNNRDPDSPQIISFSVAF